MQPIPLLNPHLQAVLFVFFFVFFCFFSALLHDLYDVSVENSARLAGEHQFCPIHHIKNQFIFFSSVG